MCRRHSGTALVDLRHWLLFGEPPLPWNILNLEFNIFLICEHLQRVGGLKSVVDVA